MLFPCFKTSVGNIAFGAQFSFGNQIKSSLVAPAFLGKDFFTSTVGRPLSLRYRSLAS